MHPGQVQALYTHGMVARAWFWNRVMSSLCRSEAAISSRPSSKAARRAGGNVNSIVRPPGSSIAHRCRSTTEGLAPSLTLSPSEYFSRNCWVSCDPDERTLASTVGLIGDERIVWASDYPHLDAREGPVKRSATTAAGSHPISLEVPLGGG